MYADTAIIADADIIETPASPEHFDSVAEFALAHAGSYDHTDELVDDERFGVIWQSAEGNPIAFCPSGTVDSVMHWVYLNLK
jgi:hypothetical protein